MRRGHDGRDLVAQAAYGGLAVRLSVEGDLVPMSPTLEVSAYRIIQEALTNVRKHSGSLRATVHVRYTPSTLEVELEDDGPPALRPPPVDESPGHGLIGMREGASLHHGHLRVGPRPDGGFIVHASFPLSGQLS